MKIVFFCPPAVTINGGIKYIFRMVETLIELGYNAVVLEEKERRPHWFANSAPIVGQAILQPSADQIYVLPEDQAHMLASIKDWPQKKIIYCQNHFYSGYYIGDLKNYTDFNVSHILCSSQTIYTYQKIRNPDVPAHVVPYSINTEFFRPHVKHNRISYMPRKRPIEAIYIRDLFRHLYAQYRDWQWQELSNLSESDVAKAMSELKVFLSLSRLEGFGLTPLEAMAADCVVAGFTGIGGREYASKENGFWSDEDNFPQCIEQIKAAIELCNEEGPARSNYSRACRKTLSTYTPQLFQQAVKDVWRQILA